METARYQYSYFENLEKTIKMGLTAYLSVFIGGILIDISGPLTVAEKLGSAPRMIAAAAAFGALLIGLFHGVSRIQWLGELHIWLDRRLFGVLKRSNEIIFTELLAALDPDERGAVDDLEQEEKKSLAKSVFSHLASNEKLFGELLQSGIFRVWIWYWIMIYGTLFFTVLAVLAFGMLLIEPETITKPLFTVNWILALLHLSACLALGKRLMTMTGKTVSTIVNSHRDEIASMLRFHTQNYQIIS